LRTFAGRSGWLAVGDVSGLLLFGAELVLVGAVAGAAAAAVFGASQFVIRTVSGPLVDLLSSAGPGIARLVGEGQPRRALLVRQQLHLVGLGVGVAVGAGVIVANQTFVELWMGSDLYGGATLDVLLVVLALVTVAIRIDTLIVDACLGFRARSMVTLVGAVVGLLAGLVLGRGGGLVGATIGLLVGRLLVAGAMPVLVARATCSDPAAAFRPLVRPGVTAAVVLAGAAGTSAVVQVPASWAGVAGSAALAAAMAGTVFVVAGVDRAGRRALAARGRALAGRAPRGGVETTSA
jgi:O-antigen/teichoic acid export membrane protein